jgi:hypothetical protein
MDAQARCPECGAVWTEGQTCQDYFYQMGYWENEYPAILEVHHLMVLSYYLQHPSLYSPAGLNGAKGLLVDFVERGLTPQQVRQRDRVKLDSGNRTYKIKATPESRGSYANPVPWTMTAADIVAGGVDRYCDNVRAWARSIYEALEASGNLGT